MANIKTGDNIFLKSKGEQRGFLHTNVFSECCCIDVINTHLGLDKDERKEQLSQIIDYTNNNLMLLLCL